MKVCDKLCVQSDEGLKKQIYRGGNKDVIDESVKKRMGCDTVQGGRC